MKKVLVFILTTFYLCISIGITVDLHYCMDKIAGWEFGHHEAKICGKCGMEESGGSGCCKDKYAVFKISIDQNITSCSTLVPLFHKDFFNNPVIFNAYLDNSPIDACSITYVDPPPFLTDRRLHLLNCVFLI